jgi:hypothetical protein
VKKNQEKNEKKLKTNPPTPAAAKTKPNFSCRYKAEITRHHPGKNKVL